EKLVVDVKVARAADWTDSIQLAGFDLPQNVTIGLVTLAKGVGEGKAEVMIPANLKPGTYTFTINGAGQAPRDYNRPGDPTKPRGANMRVVYPSNAITITVAAPAKT